MICGLFLQNQPHMKTISKYAKVCQKDQFRNTREYDLQVNQIFGHTCESHLHVEPLFCIVIYFCPDPKITGVVSGSN